MNAPSPAIAADHSRASRSPGLAYVAASMRAFLTLLWLDIRRSQGYWALPVMVGIGVYAPSIDHLPEIVLWPEMSMATLEAYVVVGPLAAALAAWLVGRERRRRTRDLAETVPGSGVRRDLLALGVASFWGLAGYAGVAIWFCGQAVLWATWGGPNVGLMATGAIAVVAFVAIGVLVGRVLPSKFSPLLALGATFFLTIGTDLFKITDDDGSYRNPIQLLMPFGLSRANYPNVFYRENHEFVLDVGLWMLALVGLLIAVIAVLRARNVRTWVALAGTVVLAVLAAAPLIGPDLAWGPESWTLIAYTPVCQQQDGFEVCVHPAYESALDETARQVSSTFGPVQGLEGVASRWEQSNPAQVRNGDETGDLYDVGYDYALINSLTVLFPEPVSESGHPLRPATQLVIMNWLHMRSTSGERFPGWFGWPAEVPFVEQDYGDGFIGTGPDEAALAAFQPRMDAALERFAALPEADQRAWLETNWDALRVGELTLEDLP